MSVKIKIPVSLRRFTSGKKYIENVPGTIYDISNNIKKEYPAFSKKILNNDNKFKPYVTLVIDGKVLNKDKVNKEIVNDGEVINLVLTIAGGWF